MIDLNIGPEDPNDDFAYAEDGHGQKPQGPGYRGPSRRALDLILLVKYIRQRAKEAMNK